MKSNAPTELTDLRLDQLESRIGEIANIEERNSLIQSISKAKEVKDKIGKPSYKLESFKNSLYKC